MEGIKADGTADVLVEEAQNHQRLILRDVSGEYAAVRLIPLESWGVEDARVFSFDVR